MNVIKVAPSLRCCRTTVQV